MKIKKLPALFAALAMILGLTACGGPGDDPAAGSDPPAVETPAPVVPADGVAGSITLWTYPVGQWGDEAAVKALTDGFEAETGITVTVECLTSAEAEARMEDAFSTGNTPDLILGNPERLVAAWGTAGRMVDLGDLLDDTARSGINATVMAACTHASGAVYMYPLAMNVHCMAVNLTAFREAGADGYLHLDTRTWSTEEFKSAVAALNGRFGSSIGAVCCAGRGGDQGTRALVNNLYGGTFTNESRTGYTWDSPENILALTELRDMKGIYYDPSIVGGDEIGFFYQGVLKMAFCWNVAQQKNPNSAGTGSGKTLSGDEIAFMAFPTESGAPRLQGEIWGFGVFDKGDSSKIAAARLFLQYMCDSTHTADAVRASGCFPVRSTAGGVSLDGIWAEDDIMSAYQILLPYLDDYDPVTPGWAAAREEWWIMLQEVGRGIDPGAAVREHVTVANNAARAAAGV